ncbi:MAG TPA: flavin reductase family protein [Solirubrobacteraceae bacterium]|jgi:flavin reductase (DIM6/NTAB) family NADH-FMN oxidoreductase RutF
MAAQTTPGISGQEFRAALGAFATGVTVITTRGEEHAYGMTANAFSSVSLDPPLVLVCTRTLSDGCELILRNGVFAVNILAAHQEPVSRFFSNKDRPRGRDSFRDVAHHSAASGAPILDGAAAFLDCRLHVAHEAGDHHVLVGEVIELGVAPDAEPLLFHGGRYRLLHGE